MPPDPSSPPPSPARVVPLAPARPPLLVRLAEHLNPIALFFGPVFQRDTRVLGRKKGTYWVRSLYAAALTGFVSLVFTGMVVDANITASGAASIQRLQDLAPNLALALGWFQLISLLLIAPMLTAAAICDEKRNKTMAALATSPLTAAQIICSSLLSRVVQISILLLLAAPLLLALRVFGGLEAESIIGITAITVTAAILAAALGLWCSVHAKRPATAAGLALFWCVVLCLLPVLVLLCHAIFRGGMGPPRNPVGIEVSIVMSPAFSLALTTVPGGFPFGRGYGEPWIANAISNLVLTAIVCTVATFQLRRVLLREAAEAPPVVETTERKPRGKPGVPGSPSDSDGSLAHQTRRGFLASLRASISARIAVLFFGLCGPGVFLIFMAFETVEQNFYYRNSYNRAVVPLAMALAGILVGSSIMFLLPARRVRRTVGDEPVRWRELRQASFGNQKFSAVIVVAAFTIMALAYSAGALGEAPFTFFITGASLILLGLQTSALAGSTIAGEVQSRTWHVLLTSPLSASEILMGKIVGVVRRLWPVGGLLLIHYTLAILQGCVHPLGLILVAGSVISGMVFMATLGTALSLWLRKPTAATVWTMAICLGIWAAVPGGFAMLATILNMDRTGTAASYVLDFLLAYNPMGSSMMSLTGTTEQYSQSTRLRFDMPSGRMSLPSFFVLWLLGNGLLWGATVLIFGWAKRQFHIINARVP